MIAFNDVHPKVKAAVFASPISSSEQEINHLNTIGDMWIASTRFAPSFAFGVSGVLGGTTAEFIADFKNKNNGQMPAALDPVSFMESPSFSPPCSLSPLLPPSRLLSSFSLPLTADASSLCSSSSLLHFYLDFDSR